jgi:hypothetical protein
VKDRALCAHRTYEPVLVADEVVANVCADCLSSLPHNWRCDRCDWIEIRTLSSFIPSVYPGRPCEEHR